MAVSLDHSQTETTLLLRNVRHFERPGSQIAPPVDGAMPLSTHNRHRHHPDWTTHEPAVAAPALHGEGVDPASCA